MKKSNESTIYQLEGMPSAKFLVPFGIQHVLAMFVSNIAPMLIIAGVIGLEPGLTRILVQAAMFTSGIATIFNVYGIKIGKFQIGARLPLMMGVSFTFVGIASEVGAAKGLGVVIGASIAAAFIEIFLGLFYKHIKKLFNPLVTGTLLVALGLYLISVGANYFLGGFGPHRGTPEALIAATVTLLVVLGLRIYGHGLLKSAAVLIGIVVGYIISIPLGLVSFDGLSAIGIISFEQMIPFRIVKPEFDISAIIAFAFVYFASAVETIGDIKGVAMGGLNRDATDEELSGGLIADGLGSIFSSSFNALPNTSFGQNVGIVTSTKVINKNVLGFGGLFLIVMSLFPRFSEVIRLTPDAVIGGALITVFAIITANGFKMLSIAGSSDNNLFIIATSFALGLGLGGNATFLGAVPEFVGVFFSTTVVATTVVAIIMCILVKPDWSKGEYDPDESKVINEYIKEI